MHNILLLCKKQILYYRQFGVRKDLSTNHAILNLQERIEKAQDDRQLAHARFL